MPLSRREWLAIAGSSAAVLRAQTRKRIPVGLLVYGVRDDLDRDLSGTLKAVAAMGYEGVEFYGPYFYWTAPFAKKVRAQLDDLHLPCLSTHNESFAFTPDGMSHAIELNQILGSKNIVCVRGLVNPGPEPYHGFEGAGLDGWKRLAETLHLTLERLRPLGIKCGFHNHAVEYVPLQGTRPIDLLAGVKDLIFHLDVAICRDGKADPVAFLEKYPGRTQSILLSDWPRDPKGIQPLLGKGKEDWKRLFAAAERLGGVEFYLMQQETSADPAMEAIRKDLAYFRELHG